MNAIGKKERMELTFKIEDILNQNCRICPEKNTHFMSNEVCQTCPALKELQQNGTQLGWKDSLVNTHDYPEEYLKLAKSNGIERNLFNHRVQKGGWSYEKAATTPKHSTRKKNG